MQFGSVDELLADARSRLTRVTAGEAADAVAAGARLVDIRPGWQRTRDGEIPGATVVEHNHLHWRLDPRSSARLDGAVEGQRWIVVCAEGYSSSLAAGTLNAIGVPATDLVDGFQAWAAAGLPVTAGGTPPDSVVGAASWLPT